MRFISRYINHSEYRIGDPAMYIPKNNLLLFNDLKECFQIKGSKNNNNYQLRIITTNELQFQVNNNNFQTIGHLSENVTEYNRIDQICFKLNETIVKGENDKNKQKEQAFFFQIIDNNIDSNYSIVEPLYENWEYTDKLKKGQSRWYRNAKLSKKKTNTFIRVTNGTINVYQALCTAFPYCYQKDNLKNDTKLIYAFSTFISSMESNENFHQGFQNQSIYYVICMEEKECEFTISYQSQDPSLKLKENETYSNFLKNTESEKYFFNVNKESKKKLYLVLIFLVVIPLLNLKINSHKIGSSTDLQKNIFLRISMILLLIL